jgi:solute:Na+ symporter, SSS family
MMDIQIFIAFCVYFLILLTIGILSHKKLVNSADFIMGNRSLNFWVIALSAHASDMSSWLFMGFPAAIFIRGMSQFWIAVGLLAGMFFNWQIISKKLRTLTEKYGCYTLSTFFEKRFHDNSGMIRILTACMSVIFLTSYLSAGLIGMGLLFESIFHIDYYIGLTIATLVVLIYTFVGGFITVAWTDLFQALFLLIVIIVVPITAYFNLPNGWTSILESAQAQGISLKLIHHLSGESVLTILFLVFGWGLGYFGQPHIITKFMGIKKAEELNKSKYLGMTWMCITLAAAASVGLVGIAFFHQGLETPELVFVKMVSVLFNPLLAGFILCAVIAASMSTMDSQILVCASVISEDVYKHMRKKTPSPQFLLRVARGAVIIISLIALCIAFNKSSTVLDAVQYAWSGLGCAFGPLVLMSLYSETTNKYGAIAGILIGGMIVFFWDALNPYLTEYPIPAMIPGFSLSLFSIWMVSRLSRNKVHKSPALG